MSDPNTHFGYGIHFGDDFMTMLFEQDLDADTWIEDASKKIAEEFGCEHSVLGLREDAPVCFACVDAGEEEVAMFLQTNYKHWDWNDNGSEIDPAIFNLPMDAMHTLTLVLKTIGLSEDMASEAKFFALNYEG